MESLLSEVASELVSSTNPYLTKETIVLRYLKNIVEKIFNLSWYGLMDTIRLGQLNFDQHNSLLRIVNSQQNYSLEENGTSNEQRVAVEKLLSRDYVRTADVTKLANLMNSRGSPSMEVYRLFAVDGFRGTNDLKKYVDNFKWNLEEYKSRHVKAVRVLYGHVIKPENIKMILDHIFRNKNYEEDDMEEDESINHRASETYLNIVGSDCLPLIVKWKLDEEKANQEQQEQEHQKDNKNVAKRRNKSNDISAGTTKRNSRTKRVLQKNKSNDSISIVSEDLDEEPPAKVIKVNTCDSSDDEEKIIQLPEKMKKPGNDGKKIKKRKLTNQEKEPVTKKKCLERSVKVETISNEGPKSPIESQESRLSPNRVLCLSELSSSEDEKIEISYHPNETI